MLSAVWNREVGGSLSIITIVNSIRNTECVRFSEGPLSEVRLHCTCMECMHRGKPINFFFVVACRRSGTVQVCL